MAQFLDLPPELRMEIYNYLLVPPRDGKCTVHYLSPVKAGKVQTRQDQYQLCSKGDVCDGCIPTRSGSDGHLTRSGALPYLGILGTSKFIRQEALPILYDNSNLNLSIPCKYRRTDDSIPTLRAWVSTLTPVAIHCVKSFAIEPSFGRGFVDDVADACQVLAAFPNLKHLSIIWAIDYVYCTRKDIDKLTQPLQILRINRECDITIKTVKLGLVLSPMPKEFEHIAKDFYAGLEKYKGRQWWGLNKWARSKDGGRLVSR